MVGARCSADDQDAVTTAVAGGAAVLDRHLGEPLRGKVHRGLQDPGAHGSGFGQIARHAGAVSHMTPTLGTTRQRRVSGPTLRSRAAPVPVPSTFASTGGAGPTPIAR